VARIEAESAAWLPRDVSSPAGYAPHIDGINQAAWGNLDGAVEWQVVARLRSYEPNLWGSCIVVQDDANRSIRYDPVIRTLGTVQARRQVSDCYRAIGDSVMTCLHAAPGPAASRPARLTDASHND